MGNIELLFISISLAMDAFSVSLCKGLSMKYKFKRNALILAISFSFFQMLMPLIGYFLGNILSKNFLSFNNIVAFGLLTIIGINMIRDSFNKNDIKSGLSKNELLSLSIATSIDAMAVGITFSFFKVNLVKVLILIGIITFILSLSGVLIGKMLGNKLDTKAQILGGIILIILGIKFLFN